MHDSRELLSNGLVKFGYNIDSQTRADFLLSYVNMREILFTSKFIIDNDRDSEDVVVLLGYKMTSGFVNIYRNIYNIDKLNLFAHAGVGINHSTKTRWIDVLKKGGSEDSGIVQIGVKDNVLAWKVGVGIDHPITSNIIAQIQYDYSNLDAYVIGNRKFTIDDSSKEAEFSIDTKEAGASIYSHNISFSVRALF